jgi:hypothetical protein
MLWRLVYGQSREASKPHLPSGKMWRIPAFGFVLTSFVVLTSFRGMVLCSLLDYTVLPGKNQASHTLMVLFEGVG